MFEEGGRLDWKHAVRIPRCFGDKLVGLLGEEIQPILAGMAQQCALGRALQFVVCLTVLIVACDTHPPPGIPISGAIAVEIFEVGALTGEAISEQGQEAAFWGFVLQGLALLPGGRGEHLPSVLQDGCTAVGSERADFKRKGGKHFPGQLQIRNLGWLAEMIAGGIRELPELPEPLWQGILERVPALRNPLDIGTHGERVLCLTLLGLRQAPGDVILGRGCQREQEEACIGGVAIWEALSCRQGHAARWQVWTHSRILSHPTPAAAIADAA
jgi:hypothetical protein